MIQLNDEHQIYVEQLVQTGRYADENDVLQTALKMLKAKHPDSGQLPDNIKSFITTLKAIVQSSPREPCELCDRLPEQLARRVATPDADFSTRILTYEETITTSYDDQELDSQDYGDESTHYGPHYLKENGTLLHAIPIELVCTRDIIKNDLEVWLLRGNRLFLCEYTYAVNGHYRDGTSISGCYTETRDTSRSQIAVLNCHSDGRIDVVRERLGSQ